MKDNQKRPNIVFVITDDQGYPPLGCHGHPFLKTPNVDRFYSESSRFDQFHVGTTCAPTRAGMLTGHHCNSTGVWHTIGGRSLLRRDEWTLAAALGEAGYSTGLFGKWHLGDDFPYRPQDRGFQEVVCHGGGGISQQPDYWGNDYFDDTYFVNGEPTKHEGYCTDVFFQRGLDFIERHRDEPFFCMISTNAPHGPFNVDPAYRDLYTEHTDSDAYARFLGMITNIDENFGGLRRRLQELDLEQNTILIFMSDNGQTPVYDGDMTHYNAGMRGFKGDPYDGGHRVPFFLRWPDGGLSASNEIQHLTSYVDFMPTMLDLCGVEVPPNRTFHGDSLKPLLNGNTDDPHWTERTVTMDTQRLANPVKGRLSCVMKNTWRLVNGSELYDIEEDPGQEQDISDQHPELVEELQQAYEEWWTLCSGQFDDDIPISIGADEQAVAVLRSHDMRNETESGAVYSQSQVRQGVPCSGWWEIFVEQPGRYEFELMRWPDEAGHRVRGAVEGDDIEFYEEGIEPSGRPNYTGSVALDIDEAFLAISGGPERRAPVSEADRSVCFDIDLERGPRHVRAAFLSSGQALTAAYYVYVRRVAN